MTKSMVVSIAMTIALLVALTLWWFAVLTISQVSIAVLAIAAAGLITDIVRGP